MKTELALPLLLLGTALAVVSATEQCADPPRCFSDGIKPACAEWQEHCNGEFCQSVCATLHRPGTNGTSSPPVSTTASLAFQRRLQRHLPLPYAQFVGTHNSYISPANGIGVEDEALTRLFHGTPALRPATVVIGNQRLTLTQQLDMGVRHLELDINQLPVVTGPQIRLCHWPVAPIFWIPWVLQAYWNDGGSRWTGPKWKWWRMGCFHGSNKFSAGLEEIDAWLTKNPHEFIMVYLDNRVPVRHCDQLMTSVRGAFGSKLLTPLLMKTEFLTDGEWPSTAQLVERGYQVMIENGDNYGCHAVNPAANDTMWMVRSAWRQFGNNGFRGYPACTAKRRVTHLAAPTVHVWNEDQRTNDQNIGEELLSTGENLSFMTANSTTLSVEQLRMVHDMVNADSRRQFGADYDQVLRSIHQVNESAAVQQEQLNRPSVNPQQPIYPQRMRAFEASLAFGPSTLFENEGVISPRRIRAMLKCGVSIIDVDQMTPTLIENFVWTWAPGQPDPLYNCTAISPISGRWYTRPCHSEYPMLYRRQGPPRINNIPGQQTVFIAAAQDESPINAHYRVDWSRPCPYANHDSARCRPRSFHDDDSVEFSWTFSSPRVSWENTLALQASMSPIAGEYFWVANDDFLH